MTIRFNIQAIGISSETGILIRQSEEKGGNSLALRYNLGIFILPSKERHLLVTSMNQWSGYESTSKSTSAIAV